MAWEFWSTPTATVKAKLYTTEPEVNMITIKGVTTASITPTKAAQHINTLLGVAGKSIVVDNTMTRSQIEEAIENG